MRGLLRLNLDGSIDVLANTFEGNPFYLPMISIFQLRRGLVQRCLAALWYS